MGCVFFLSGFKPPLMITIDENDPLYSANLRYPTKINFLAG